MARAPCGVLAGCRAADGGMPECEEVPHGRVLTPSAAARDKRVPFQMRCTGEIASGIFGGARTDDGSGVDGTPSDSRMSRVAGPSTASSCIPRPRSRCLSTSRGGTAGLVTAPVALPALPSTAATRAATTPTDARAPSSCLLLRISDDVPSSILGAGCGAIPYLPNRSTAQAASEAS
eukprot:scaffold56631_cov33-Tisochrysis_lutea.AAC.2